MQDVLKHHYENKKYLIFNKQPGYYRDIGMWDGVVLKCLFFNV